MLPLRYFMNGHVGLVQRRMYELRPHAVATATYAAAAVSPMAPASFSGMWQPTGSDPDCCDALAACFLHLDGPRLRVDIAPLVCAHDIMLM